MINSILMFIVMASALLFGAVEIWSSSVILALVYSLGLVWTLGRGYADYSSPPHTKLLMITGFTFTLYACLQIVPLPLIMLKYLSPGAHRLREFYSLEPSRNAAISLVPYRSLLEVLKVAAFFIVFSVASTYFISRDRLKSFVIALSVFGFCLAVFAIVQKATWNGRVYWFRELSMGGEPFGPFVNRNHFAGFTGMIIPLTLGLAIIKHTREKKIFYGFLSVIMSVAVFFSLSRGGIVSFCSGMALFGVLLLASRLQQRKVWLIGIFLVAVLTYLVWLGVDPIMARFSQTDITKEQRLIVWSTTLTAAKDFWLTGSGLGTFLNVFPLYSPASVQSIYDHAHNDYLEFLLETGLGGALLLACFIGILLRSVFRSSFEGRQGIMLMAALSSMTSMAVHSLFDFNLHILSNLLLFGMVLGMIAALSDVDDPHPPRERRKKARAREQAANGEELMREREHAKKEAEETPDQDAGSEDRPSNKPGPAPGPVAEEDGITPETMEEWEKELKKNR